MKTKRIAIVGGGISGLSTAYQLHNDYDVSIFEQNDYFGGHTDTHTLAIDGQQMRIDSGFIIFCPEYYPNFSDMLDKLGVESQATNMSFSVHNQQSETIYNASSLNKIFCQRRNLLRPGFYGMLIDLVKFYRGAHQVLGTDDEKLTVKEYLAKHNYGARFSQDHLLPMVSALWSATPAKVEQYPIGHLVRFFKNHGLLKLFNRPQWLVVKNGSASYVEALQKELTCQWHVKSAVVAVDRRSQGATVITEDNTRHDFDAVVMATHSDQALALLSEPSDQEKMTLGAIKFEKNEVLVHTDDTIMHANKKAWASWNTVVPTKHNPNSLQCCTANYWMNSLQGLKTKTNIFTSLNSHYRIDPNKILAKREYSHPIFTEQSVAAQKQKSLIDGQRRTYYTGAYWGWGFHEDGARTAAQVSQLIREQI